MQQAGRGGRHRDALPRHRREDLRIIEIERGNGRLRFSIPESLMCRCNNIMSKYQLPFVSLAGCVCFCWGQAITVAAESELQKLFRTTILVQTTREKLQVIPEKRQ